MRQLSELSRQELVKFFDSFDTVLSDVDGVLWNVLSPIPGTDQAVKSLRHMGKRIVFVSNNTSKTTEMYLEQFRKANIEVTPEDVVTPIPVIVSYLKEHNLGNKKVFVLGMTPLKEALQNNGFHLAPNGPDRIKESVKDFITAAFVNDNSIGAVIADSDINVNFVNLQRGIHFLSQPDVLFLKGASDVNRLAGLSYEITSPEHFHKLMEYISGREAIPMAKPSPHLHKYIVEKYGIVDVSRVLFIGDSISVDMGFAAQSGYQKLLVLSGLTSRDDLEKWQFPDGFKPEFYVDSLEGVHEAIMRAWQAPPSFI